MKTAAQVIPLLLAVLLVGCARSPVSPPAALPGHSPEFDSLLSDADAKWSFVFADDFRIRLVDAFGVDQEVLLDIRDKTQEPKAKFLGCESISPDGRFILAAYYHSRTPDENQPDAKLVLLDLDDLTMHSVPHEHEDFRLAWHDDTHWLNNTTFLVPLNKFTDREGGGSAEHVRYLRKHVGDRDSATVVTFPTDDPVRVWAPGTSSLLFASEHEPTTSWAVHAIDLRGVRPASSAEVSYFNHKWKDRGYVPTCPVSITTLRVVGNAVEGWGKYWDENWFRYWVILDGKKVRCSDGEIERDAVWDQDLKLLIWYEIGSPYQVFRMNTQGHYRQWHSGAYWGKIPKRRTASNQLLHRTQ